MSLNDLGMHGREFGVTHAPNGLAYLGSTMAPPCWDGRMAWSTGFPWLAHAAEFSLCNSNSCCVLSIYLYICVSSLQQFVPCHQVNSLNANVSCGNDAECPTMPKANKCSPMHQNFKSKVLDTLVNATLNHQLCTLNYELYFFCYSFIMVK